MSSFSSVRAGQVIPACSISLPFTSKIDLKKVLISSPLELGKPIEVFCTHDGLLYIEQQISSFETHWASLVEIAKNCSEHNITLNRIIGTNQYQLRTIRVIPINEPFKLWPNLSLLNEWNIPYFLQPSCIINKDLYKCNQCLTVYQEPNQLKIHLAFLCKPIVNKIVEENEKNSKTLFLTNSSINLNLHTSFNHSLHSYLLHSNASNSKKVLNSNINSSLKKNNISANNNESSFFKFENSQKRKLNEKQDLIKALNMLSNENSSSNKRNMKSHLNLIESDLSSSDTLDEIISEKEISSSINVITKNNSYKHKSLKITKEPRSHTCVFCGKLYTRKYGLKIHIRTHTGHKPLKCVHCSRAFSDPSNLNKHMRLHQQHRHWNKHVNLKT